MADQDAAPSLLLCCTHAPYGSGHAPMALDIALAYAAFGQTVSLLFLDHGVLQLAQGQRAEIIGQKNIAKILSSLALYDIGCVYADSRAMQSFGLLPEHCATQVELVDTKQIIHMHEAANFVFSF